LLQFSIYHLSFKVVQENTSYLEVENKLLLTTVWQKSIFLTLFQLVR